jgi:hypothetical protein
MNCIQVDFISLTIGYVVGFVFCWSVCELIYGEKENDA